MFEQILLKKNIILICWIGVNIINNLTFFLTKAVSVNDYVCINVISLIFLIGIKVIKYKKDIWGMVIIAYLDYLLIEFYAIKNIKIDGNECTVFLNILLFLLFIKILFLLFNSYCTSLIISQIMALVLAIVNYYLYRFRGRTLYFSDLKSVRTVLNVAQQYDLNVDKYLVIQIICLFLTVYMTYKLTLADCNYNSGKQRVKEFIKCILVLVVLYNGIVLNIFGYQVYWWSNSSQNGFLVGLILQAENYGIHASKEYNVQMIDELSKELRKSDFKSDNPDIIVIMNESFSDLSIINEFETNQDIMPYLHSLTENCVKGNLYVSVRGGNTANTEYEFLTGASMAFYKYGQVVYNSYLNHPIYSNVSHLNNLSYSSKAFHPYFKSGWNRENAYKYLQFEDAVFSEDLWAQGIGAVNLRELPSDEYTYEQLYNLYTAMPDDRQRFLFCVTMQNHGGYDDKEWISQQKISLTGKDKDKYPLTSQYLSLIYESDKAIKDLIDRYQNVDRKVVICFFGDHQPGIENKFYKKLFGKSLDKLTLEETQKEYITPFFIWTNYDIESQYVDKISANYLFAYMCRVAGVEMSAYDNYLLDLYNKYPVINSIGGIDANNNYYTVDELKNIKDIQQYFDIIYNQMIDEKNVIQNMFE